jgi:hypothetical protein
MDLKNLFLEPASHQLIKNRSGQIIAWSTHKSPTGHGLVVRADWLQEILTTHNLDCLWITVGEREAWNDGDQYGAQAYRRFNAIELLSRNRRSSTHWFEDFPAGRGSECVMAKIA